MNKSNKDTLGQKLRSKFDNKMIKDTEVANRGKCVIVNLPKAGNLPLTTVQNSHQPFQLGQLSHPQKMQSVVFQNRALPKVEASTQNCQPLPKNFDVFVNKNRLNDLKNESYQEIN